VIKKNNQTVRNYKAIEHSINEFIILQIITNQQCFTK